MSEPPGAGFPRAIDLSQKADGGWVLRLEWRTSILSMQAGQIDTKEQVSYRTIECDAKTAENLRSLLAPIVRVQ